MPQKKKDTTILNEAGLELETDNKPSGKPPQYTVAQVKEAILQSRGIVSVAARMLKCDRRTIYKYMDRHPELEQAREDARENLIDYAESKLVERIADSDIKAIMFYLRTQAKHRGYSERQEITGADGNALTLTLVHDDNDNDYS